MIEALNDAIREKFKTDAAFGMSIGFTPQKVHKLLHGDYIPKIGEAVIISQALEKSIDEVANFFAQ